jgi:hypothetical protein
MSRAICFALRIERLRSSDILLTRAPGALSSEAIRPLSGIKLLSGDDRAWVREEFSHAVVYVGSGTFVEALGSAGVCSSSVTGGRSMPRSRSALRTSRRCNTA